MLSCVTPTYEWTWKFGLILVERKDALFNETQIFELVPYLHPRSVKSGPTNPLGNEIKDSIFQSSYLVTMGYPESPFDPQKILGLENHYQVLLVRLKRNFLIKQLKWEYY